MEFSEYIEFELDGDDFDTRVALLIAFVEHLRAAKAADPGRQIELPDADVSRWLALLPRQFIGGFGFSPSPHAWSPRGGFSEPSWDVESMLEALLHAEYELDTVRHVDASTAQLRFFALAYPYGGVDSLVRLVEGFGFVVRAVQDGCGLDHWERRAPPSN